MTNPSYPDDVSGLDICYMERYVGDGYCHRCGHANYRLCGYKGAVTRWANEWGVSKREAERRINRGDNKC